MIAVDTSVFPRGHVLTETAEQIVLYRRDTGYRDDPGAWCVVETFLAADEAWARRSLANYLARDRRTHAGRPYEYALTHETTHSRILHLTHDA